MKRKEIDEIRAAYKFRQKKAAELDYDYYRLRSLHGIKTHCVVDGIYDWYKPIFFCLLGGREAGKSYAVMEEFIKDWKRFGRPFTWFRLTETSVTKLLTNKADKLVDADIRRRFKLDLWTKGNDVYDGMKRMARVLALSTFYSDKGVAMFDKDFDLGYNICLDEMNREQSERKAFDINYCFVNQMENVVRSTKHNIRVYLIGNTLQEASDIMCSFNFIPEEFGRYVLHKKRCVVDYMPPTRKYLQRRRGTVADILSPDSSTFTNIIEIDKSLVDKRRLVRPTHVIKFGKENDKKFTVWDDRIIAPYNGEKVPEILMKPYLDGVFMAELRDNVILRYDARYYHFRTLFIQKNFTRNLSLIKPRGN